MGTVIDLNAHRPHLAGDARCKCGHTWLATAPIGTVSLECPFCRTMRGLFVFAIGLDEPVLVCKCDAHLFYATRTGDLVYRECGERYA